MKDGSRIDERWRRSKVHFIVIGAVMLYLLALLGQNTRFVELNTEFVQSERQRHRLEEETAYLTYQRERLRDPGRIRSLAVERLGMVPPDPERVHTLGEVTPQTTPQ
jgi:cell division protein FtsL